MKGTNNEKLVLSCPALFYRRREENWPISYLGYAFLSVLLLASRFLFHWKSGLIFAAILLAIELPSWLDKPRCLIDADNVTVKRKRYTYRKFRLADLYAMGRYQEDGAEPMLFFCVSSAEKIRSFAGKHAKELASVAAHYGYDGSSMTEEQRRQVMLTVYLWKKAKISNPNTAVLCITAQSWAKLDEYRGSHSLPCVTLSAPMGGCYNEY